MTDHQNKPGVMRSLGAFVGEIVRAVKTDPQKYDQQRPKEIGDDDEVILRRTTTTVDEVRLRRNEQSDK